MGATVWVGICSRHEVRGAACLSSPSDGRWPVGPLDRDWCHPGHRRHRVCSSSSSSGHLPRMQQKPTCKIWYQPDSYFANQPLLYYNNSSTSNNYYHNIRNNNHNCSRGNHDNHNYSIRDNNNNYYYYNYSSRSNNYNYNFNYNYNNNYYDNYYNNYNYNHNYNNSLSLYCH